MFHPTEDFHKYIHPGKRVHLAGIGGVSMCALAEVLQGMGVTVPPSSFASRFAVTFSPVPVRGRRRACSFWMRMARRGFSARIDMPRRCTYPICAED